MEVLINAEAREFIMNNAEGPRAVVVGVIQEKSG